MLTKRDQGRNGDPVTPGTVALTVAGTVMLAIAAHSNPHPAEILEGAIEGALRGRVNSLHANAFGMPSGREIKRVLEKESQKPSKSESPSPYSGISLPTLQGNHPKY